MALCVNERTLLSVVVPLAPKATFVGRFRTAALRRLWDIPVPAPLLFEEENALSEVGIGRTQSRSILGVLNELCFLGRDRLWLDPAIDLDDLGRRLCHTPLFALKTAWPFDEAVGILTGAL